jgi:uncharacterized protein (DUF305 family)
MQHAHEGHGKKNHYGRLLIMTVISFIVMYVLMYAMVDRFANVHPSFNQFYMAGLMAASMVAIELMVMGGMYPNRKLNVLLIAGSLGALALFWILIRKQTAIGDRQFVKSMIPHHSGAVLMCRQATLTDPELVRLCDGIVRGQQQEIDQMNAILRRLDAK